jgi:hypothetical protein
MINFNIYSKIILFFLINIDVWGQLARTSTNLMDPEVNDHVSLQSPSY